MAKKYKKWRDKPSRKSQKARNERIQNEKARGESIRSSATQNLRHMRYDLYLKTDHWQHVRKRALDFAKNSCQICNAKGTLNVHHRTYKRRGSERPDDVIVLCRSCHQIFHENGVINELKYKNEQLTGLPP